MANSKSQQHPIALLDPDLCMDRYDGEINQWAGFDDRLGPYLSRECLPLWSKSYQDPNVWLDANLNEYTISGNTVYKNNSFLRGFTAPIRISDAPDTFRLGTQEVKGQFLGIHSNVRGIYYNNEILIVDSTGIIIASSPVSSYTEAYNYFSIIKLTYNNEPLYAWFSGPYCYVHFCPYHIEEKDQNGFYKENIDKNFITYSCPFPVDLTMDTQQKLYSTIWGFSDIRRRDIYDSVYYSDKSYSGIVFQAGKFNQDPVVLALPDSYSDGNIWIAGGIYECRPYNNIYAWTNNHYWDQTIYYQYTPQLNECIISMDGSVIYGDYVCDYNNYNYATPRQIQDMYLRVTGDNNNPNIGVSTRLTNVGTEVDLSGLTWGFTRDAIKHTRYLTLVPLCYNEDQNNFDNNYGYMGSSDRRYSSNLEDTKALSLFGQETHRNRTNLGTTYSLRLLYEAGDLSTISIGEGNYRGSIVQRWGSVIDAFVEDNGTIYFETTDNKWHYVNFGASLTFEVYKNRYMIFNVGDYFNCYDTEKQKWYHVADDWNNRLTFGMASNPAQVPGFWLATGTDSNYIIDNNPFPGYQSSVLFHKVQVAYPDVIITNTTTFDTFAYLSRIDYDDSEITTYLDIYRSKRITATDTDNSSDTTPAYIVSWSNQAYVIYDKDLLWSSEAGNAILNPPLFSKYKTGLYTVVDLGGSKAPLINDAQKEIVIYYLMSSSENYDDLFCVQTMFFLISDGYIWRITLDGGVISNPQKIVDVRMLKYVACNQIAAYFWSSDTKSIYMFAGDAMLKPMKGCSRFNEIYDSYYKANSREIFLLTDKGAYIGNEEYMYRIPGNWSTVFQTNYGFSLRGPTSLSTYAYYKNALMPTRIPTVLETMLYGVGDNVVSTTDCIYIRIYNSNPDDETDRKVKISGYTLTDIATPLQEDYKEFTITKDDWDSKNNTYYLRYQPTYQKGLGIKIRVESDESIVYLGFGNRYETLQISHS